MKFIVTNAICCSGKYSNSDLMNYEDAIALCTTINVQAKRGLTEWATITEETCKDGQEYYYYAVGENVPEVAFDNHEKAWGFIETHAGYDCVLETHDSPF